MEKVVLSIIVVFVAFLPATESSALSECLEELGVDVKSRLIERNVGSPSVYDEINFQWQQRGTYRYPMAYLKIHSEADVQAAVKCGRHLKLEVVARSGGHGYIKSAYGQNDNVTLILDFKSFNSITVDSNTKTAQIYAGALLGHVAYELWDKGNFMFPYGICSSVGISGYALGGGHSIFAYQLGMSIDSIIELEMVNANAELLTTNNETNADLFWALRGAGATGSFGIVTKLVYQLYPAPQQIINVDMDFDFEQFHEVYSAFQASVNLSLNYRFTLSDGIIRATISDAQNATETETIGMQRVQQIIDLLPAPSNSSFTVLTFPDFLTQFVRVSRGYGYIRPNVNISEPRDLLNVNSYGTGSEWFKAKALFVKKLLNPSEIMELQQLLSAINLPDLYISVELFSGKINDFDPHSHSSFIHRTAYFNLFIYMIREREDNPELSAKLNDFFEKSKLLLDHTSSFQNYADDEMSDALERYYGDNLPRLIDIKTAVDPTNFFHNNPQAIPLKNFSNGKPNSGTISNFIILIILYAYICK